MTTNPQIVLARRPEGAPVLEDFAERSAEVREPGEGELLLKHLYLSLDPAIRGWMDDKKSYLPPIAIGAPVRSGTLSEVVRSNIPGIEPGTLVQALAAWEAYSVVSKRAIHGVIKPREGIPLHTMLSVLGGNGLTAYFGLLRIGQPKEGETVVVTAAAGGVGSIVGQLAKIHGCRTVGIAGGEEKCAWLRDELGYDATVDYKAGDLRGQMKAACPDGIDVFFDSVGGEILDEGLKRINIGARIVVCGAISQIHEAKLPPGPKNYVQLMAKRARMEGFMTLDFHADYDVARDHLEGWIREGKIRFRDELTEGLEEAPRHFLRLFDGSHRGKLMVKLAEPNEG